jgi:copper chaperone CopZ
VNTFLKYKLVVLSALILLSFPGLLQAEPRYNPKTEILQQYQLKVTGLKCESCIPDVQKSLKRLDGVRSAEVTQFDKAGSTTVVETIPGKVSEAQLVSALKSDGFRAKILSVGEPREVILQNKSGFSLFGLFD